MIGVYNCDINDKLLAYVQSIDLVQTYIRPLFILFTLLFICESDSTHSQAMILKTHAILKLDS